MAGDITPLYLDGVEAQRDGGEANKPADDDQMELNLAVSATSM
jgi:hypothetical protein